uniref:Uncharacterized protein LOC111113516 n=1 Tax=Crassostrea virginica TaxID=6565 RepID=A0A8B8BVW8_CRAVI|nr:uncharacterized protein LOC111113516 [Crassostrea virginica]
MFFYVFRFSIIVICFCKAYEDLSYKKLATQSTTSTGGVYSYVASNAVDRNETTCMRTEPMGPNSPYKSVWWKVDLGGKYNIQSITIHFKSYGGYEMQQRGRFAGFRIYASNTGNVNGSALCYEDKSQLPPLYFTTTCTASARYVIFYNDRIDGVTYPEGYEVLHSFPTELCEVIVMGCSALGVYGVDCAVPCPFNCRNNMCDIQNGNCLACEPGWVGDNCTIKCHEGWYGDDCAQQCLGHCRLYFCDHVTGLCDKGCAAGWTGSFCNETCADGRFGMDCFQNCSSHCLNDSLCDKETGHCDTGCEPGYTSENCTKAHFENNSWCT